MRWYDGGLTIQEADVPISLWSARDDQYDATGEATILKIFAADTNGSSVHVGRKNVTTSRGEILAAGDMTVLVGVELKDVFVVSGSINADGKVFFHWAEGEIPQKISVDI